MGRLFAGLCICGWLLALGSCASAPKDPELKPGAAEKHFKSIRQLTFAGTNSKPYFSPDGKKLIYQGHTHEQGCDQIRMMNVDGSDKTLVSVGGGGNTCGYFLDNDHVIFSSTFSEGPGCPKAADRSKGYAWDVLKSYDIYSAGADGSNARPLTREVGYDAESTVCGGRIVFTSARGGHSLDIYTMNVDGSAVKRLTDRPGYNGGPFFSADCKTIVFRAYHPKGKKALRAFRKALAEGSVPPGVHELFIMNADGSGKRQLTAFGAVSFSPTFFPKGDRVLFSSNRADDSQSAEAQGGPGRVFQLWAIPATAAKAADAEAITAEGAFNGFPTFSPDGKYLAFASNRNSVNPNELQIFLAEWQD